MKKIYLLGLLGCGLLGSCSNEDIINGDRPAKGNYTIEATIGDAQTRTSVDEAFDVQWSKGDKIGVYGGKVANVEFTLEGEGGTATGEFNGNFEGTPTYAYYPYSAGTSLSDKKLEMTLPTSYPYTGDSNGPMIGKYSGGAIAFKHLCGLLKVSINNIPSTATKFVLEAGSAIAGKASVADISTADAVLVPSETEAEVSKTVTVTLSETATSNKEFYFPLPVGTYESLKVSLRNETDEVLYEKAASNVEIARAGAVDMPMLDASIACLKEIAKNGGSYTLASDMVFSEPLVVAGTMTLDLNGHSITPKAGGLDKVLDISDGLILVRRGANLTINDSSSEGKGSISAGSIESIYSAVILTNKNDETDEAYKDKTATLTVNGGTLEGYYYGICGHGKRHGTSITIDGGTIKGPNGSGIYHPQDGTLTVDGGNITGADTGIEMRSGNLIVNGGEINATSAEFSANPNGSGTTIIGTAVAVSQHVTNKDLNVTLNGGTLTGIYALYEEDLQDNSSTNIKIENSNNCTFNGSIYSKSCENFISGGTFSDLTALDYLADNANVNVKLEKDCEVTALYILQNQIVTIDINKKKLTIKADQTPEKITIGELTYPNKNALIGGSLTLKNGDIENNKNGMALVSKNAKLELDNTTYTTQHTTHRGIFNDANVEGSAITVKNSTITSVYYAINTNALTNPVGSTTITLENSTFTAKETALMVNIPSTVTATDCTFNGGWQGVFLRGSTTTFTNCHINLIFESDYATSSKEQGSTWGEGNNAPAAALTAGNRSTSAYDYKTDITLTNTKFSNSGTDKGSKVAINYPAIYIDTESKEDKPNQGVTLTYDAASQTSFKAAGEGLVIQEGANVTENKPNVEQ